MRAGETELEMVLRHVHDGERHVSRQLEIIEEMKARNRPTELAERLLVNLQDIQRAHQEHLERLISK